jgi:hypothetical protein
MFEHQFQRNILKEQIFGRTEDSRETFLLFVCHWRKDSLAQTDREPPPDCCNIAITLIMGLMSIPFHLPFTCR